MLHKIFFDQILKKAENIHTGSLTFETPEHKIYDFKGSNTGLNSKIIIHDWSCITQWVTKGDIGFAETYRDGLWDTPDLLATLTVAMMNKDVVDPYLKSNKLQNLFYQFLYFFQRNSINGSKKNIHAHYDLGNEFYKLWLDPTMTYSSALYNGSNDLKTAQNNKYDRILNQLSAPSGRVLEIGCGWGGFAERAIANDGDYDVKGITLSKEQHDFAHNRLNNDAKIVIEDYRHQTGRYDHIVSIEMFEAVGEQFWPTYFSKMKELLSDNGKAVVQTITILNDRFEAYKKETDFLRSYIFPGGLLPSPKRFDEEAAKAGLKTFNNFEFGQDYARTLHQWLDNFDDVVADIKNMGFDEKFIRLWRFYLAGCSAGFASGYTNVQQIELQHA